MQKSEGASTPFLWAMGLVLTALVTGCSGGDGGSNGATANAAPGTLSVSLTDAPACGFEQVNVTVSKVRVHQSDSANENAAGWTEIILNPARTINLLNLNDPTQPNFALDNLGETSLTAGHYTQLRLVLQDNNGNQPTANWIVLQGQDPNNINNRISLETPSAIRTGVKLVHQFDVGAGQRVDLLLDFDACHSIVQRGNGTYALKPVIKVIPTVLNGIEGFVDTALLGSNVVVSAQVNGEIVRATVPNANPLPNLNRGKFFLARLPAGVNYDVVITARNSPTDTCCATAVITGVPVPSSTSITTISTSTANGGTPFTLQPSTFHAIGDTVTLINPPVVDDRDDATVIVAAKQVLAGGPTVTVRSQTASQLDGTVTVGDYSYGLGLPIAAPLRASYGALPIVPSATGQGAVAGLYTVYGSAQTPTTVYATQTPAPSSVNIFAGDRLDQDFALAP